MFERWLGGRAEFEDRVWITTERKLADVASEARVDGLEGIPSLLVYHFPETFERLEPLLAAASVDYERPRQPTVRVLEDLASRARSGHVGVLESGELSGILVPGADPVGRLPGPAGRVHLVERFPIRSRDEGVLALREVLAEDTRFLAYEALDEAWLREHVGDSVGKLLERLGMEEDEALSHPMITRALRRAQDTHQARLRPVEQPARSAEEWMRTNLRMS